MDLVRSAFCWVVFTGLVSLTSANSDHSTADAKCPGSPAPSHAWLSIEATLTGSCSDAKEEVLARVAGQSAGTWKDPHGGTYTFNSDSNDEVVVDRRSANSNYNDKIMFTFFDDGVTCKVRGCSESQGSSGGDQSTNLCNSWNLVCTFAESCCPMVHAFPVLEYRVVAKSAGASQNNGVCLGGSGGSGGGFAGAKQTSCKTQPPTSNTTKNTVDTPAVETPAAVSSGIRRLSSPCSYLCALLSSGLVLGIFA